MNPVEFWTLRTSDRNYYQSVRTADQKGSLGLEKVNFGSAFAGKISEIENNAEFQAALELDAPIFNRLVFNFGNSASVVIDRPGDSPASFFDKVTISHGHENSPARFATMVSLIRKQLDGRSLPTIGNILSPDVQKHFQAREAELARLETLTSKLLGDVEAARLERDKQFDERLKEQDSAFVLKINNLEEQHKLKLQAVADKEKALEDLKKTLDTQEAKFKRREHYRDLKGKLANYLRDLRLSTPTRRLRWPVDVFIILLLVVFGWLVYSSISGLTQVIKSTEDTSMRIFVVVKTAAASLAFVTTAIYYSKWMSHYFQRTANEEFRLRRLELDIDRASWFVELAFQWKDENNETVPAELTDVLTRHLFAEGAGDKAPEHPADIFGAALTKFSVTPSGATVEIDRRKGRSSKGAAPNPAK